MAPFARAELEQIGRKMLCNEYFGASLMGLLDYSDSNSPLLATRNSQPTPRMAIYLATDTCNTDGQIIGKTRLKRAFDKHFASKEGEMLVKSAV